MKMKRDRKLTRRILIHLSLARKTRRVLLSVVAFAVATLFVLAACSVPQNQSGQSNNQQQAGTTDWKPVEQALGKAGSMQPGDVYKVSLPRSDLRSPLAAWNSSRHSRLVLGWPSRKPAI